MNRRSQVYSSRAWAVPQGKAQGINRDTLQLNSKHGEVFLACSRFSSAASPLPESLSGAAFPAGRCGVGAGTAPLPGTSLSPHGAGTGSQGAAETATGTSAPTETLPGRERARSWSRGTALFPPNHILGRPTRTWGEKKSTDTAGGWCFSCCHSQARQGSLPSPDPPTQGRLIPGARGAALSPGSVPSWLGRHHFLLKKEKIHTKKDIQGAKPSPPTRK